MTIGQVWISYDHRYYRPGLPAGGPEEVQSRGKDPTVIISLCTKTSYLYMTMQIHISKHTFISFATIFKQSHSIRGDLRNLRFLWICRGRGPLKIGRPTWTSRLIFKYFLDVVGEYCWITEIPSCRLIVWVLCIDYNKRMRENNSVCSKQIPTNAIRHPRSPWSE